MMGMEALKGAASLWAWKWEYGQWAQAGVAVEAKVLAKATDVKMNEQW